MGWAWHLRRQDCTGCGICADVCPHAAIGLPRERAYPEPVPERCTGCMQCVQECPFDAVEVHEQTATARG